MQTKKATFLVLAAVLVFLAGGCGSSHTTTTTHPVRVIEIRPVPESARVPEGSKGADVSHFVVGTLPPTLIGGEIQLDNFGAELTGSFENVFEHVYCPFYDPNGHVWTRALGETDWSGYFPSAYRPELHMSSSCIGRGEAVRNLRYLMDTQYLAPVRALGIELSHDQIDALGDLSWNTGPGTICCTLASLLRAHAWDAAAQYILRYSYAGGNFLSGLYHRREREGQLLKIVARPETPAQRRAYKEHKLASAKNAKNNDETRIRVLAREMQAKGCYRRIKEHKPTGPKCKRWKREGNDKHGDLNHQVAVIVKLKRELQ